MTLTAEQIQDLARKLSDLRHNVNNHLSLIVAAAELIQRKPEAAPRFLPSLLTPPQKIMSEVSGFSDILEECLGIRRPGED